VTTQFLAELRVYTTVSRHRNIAAFLGCLPAVGMVLEYIDGPTLYDVLRSRCAPLPRARKIDYHDQLLSALVHLHSYGLSHGDLSLLNIHIQRPHYTSSVPPTPAGEAPDVAEGGCDNAHPGTIKLLDFGRSVSASSDFAAPEDEPADPFTHVQSALSAHLSQQGRNAFSTSSYPLTSEAPSRKMSGLGGTLPSAPALAAEPRKVEQIHPGTRPFSAPEILRGECTDPLLADAYSFGMILVCLERGTGVDVKPWEQRKDKLPAGFFDGCEVFGERAKEYLRRWDSRRRLVPDDRMEEY
jgi:serine/threonine protein kinase